MQLTIEQIKDLAMTLAKHDDKKAPLEFSNRKYGYEELNEALREQLQSLAGDYNSYRRNKNLLFELIQEVVDVVLPINIWDSLNQFADIRNVKNGDKPYFKRRTGELRARNFVTRVSPAGVYQTFKLDDEIINVPTEAFGAAALINIEEFLEGRIDFAELMDHINMGFEIAIFKEIMRHMIALNSNTLVPANNLVSAGGWDPVSFNALLNISRAYADPTIFCSQMFAEQIRPHSGFVTDAQKNELQSKGFIGTYLGTKIVVLPQTFYDATNTKEALVVPAGMAWIIPTGLDKPVKIVFEGDTITEEFTNRDFSKEIQLYKKFGVALMSNPAICIYENTALNQWPEVSGPIFLPATGEVAADATYKLSYAVN